MAILSFASSAKTATSLPVVPEIRTPHPTAPSQSLEEDHDIAQIYQWYLRTHSNRNSASSAALLPPSPVAASRPGQHHAKLVDIQPAAPRSNADFKKVLSITGLRETIGTYRHGKMRRQSTRSSTPSITKNPQPNDKKQRPRLPVAIPGGTDRPLPALPFFDTPSGSRIHSTLLEPELDFSQGVSPPSATQRRTQTSMVSPFSQPVSRHGQRLVSPMENAVTDSRASRRHKHSPQSHSGSDFTRHSGASSVHSKGSSETSLEAEEDLPAMPKKASRSASRSPTQTSGTIPVIFQSPAPSPKTMVDDFGRRMAPSTAPPRQYPQHPPIGHDTMFRPTCDAQPVRAHHSTSHNAALAYRSSTRDTNQRKRPFDATQGLLSDPPRRATLRKSTNHRPTLSEAVTELEDTLISLTTDQPTPASLDKEYFLPRETEMFDAGEYPPSQDGTSDSASPQLDAAEEEPLSPQPKLPRKSSQRQMAPLSPVFQVAKLPDTHIASQLTQVPCSPRKNSGLTLAVPERPEARRLTEDFELSPIDLPRPDIKRTITPGGAEMVLLGILRSLDHLDDLFATARVNWGFYRVYKRHELMLVKNALYQMSPPAWEFREIAFPGHDLLHAEDLEMTRPEEEYTPKTYRKLQKCDEQVIRDIKSQILDKCQSFLRPEITVALMTHGPDESARVDSALWRIWTFCKIFGSGKGREEDIVAQMDWLKGGDLAHEKSGSGIMSTDYMNDTMIGASESFAKGNGHGLTAEQLFDMMELWNCLGVLLQGFAGRTVEARQAGVFEPTHVRGGDIDGEHAMLDEWCHYLLTFGLSTILDFAAPCRLANSSAFTLAAQKGLVNWNPPVFSGTRRKFLSEATSRIYEDKIANTYAELSSREVQRQQSKLRIQRHISQLRQRQYSTDQGQESPVVDADPVIGNLTRHPSTRAAANNVVTYIPSLRSAHAGDAGSPRAEFATPASPPFPRLVAQPLLPSPPPSTVRSNSIRYSTAISMPSIEEHSARVRHRSVPEMPVLADHPLFRLHAPDAPETPQRQSSTSEEWQPEEWQPRQRHTRQFSTSSIYSRSTSGNSPRHSMFQPEQREPHNSHDSLYSRSSNNSASHPVFQQHPAQLSIYRTQSHENTADKAIYRIVEMGFTAEQARDALKVTDLGDGLRVDAAVDLLLTGGP